MKNTKIVLIVVVILVVLGGVLLVVSGGEDPLANSPTPVPTTASSQEASLADQPIATTQDINPNGYQDYDAQAVAQTDGKRILFFHASWCPTCKALDQNIRAGVVPADLTIFKVNYDTEKDLVRKYGITYQHQLVQIDEAGDKLNQWYGSYTVQQLVDELI